MTRSCVTVFAAAGAAVLSAACSSSVAPKAPTSTVRRDPVSMPRTAQRRPQTANTTVARTTPRTVAPAPTTSRCALAPAPAPAPTAATRPPTATTRAMNATCPVLVGNPVDPMITTRWKGSTVAFSSTTARLMWETDPSRYSANVGGISGSAGDAGAPTIVRLAPAAAPAAASGTIVTTTPSSATAARMGAGGASPVVSAPAPIFHAPPAAKPVIVAAPAAPAAEEECDECAGGVCRVPGR
jgi:hypothetical protein